MRTVLRMLPGMRVVAPGAAGVVDCRMEWASPLGSKRSQSARSSCSGLASAGTQNKILVLAAYLSTAAHWASNPAGCLSSPCDLLINCIVLGPKPGGLLIKSMRLVHQLHRPGSQTHRLAYQLHRPGFHTPAGFLLSRCSLLINSIALGLKPSGLLYLFTALPWLPNLNRF